MTVSRLFILNCLFCLIFLMDFTDFYQVEGSILADSIKHVKQKSEPTPNANNLFISGKSTAKKVTGIKQPLVASQSSLIMIAKSGKVNEPGVDEPKGRGQFATQMLEALCSVCRKQTQICVCRRSLGCSC